ncbi:MAG: protein kinase, partial [Candidatus Margulisiibacteriota bacterium]
MAPIAKPVSSVLVEGSFLKRWGARLVPFAATATPIVVMERQLSMWSMNPIGLTDALAGGSAAAALGLLVTGLVVSAAKSSLRKFENAGLQAEIGGMQAQLGELSGQLKELDAANDEKIKRLGEKDRTIAELNDALKQAKSAGIEEIGSGAMGKVVKYFDLAEKSVVAKKTLHIALCQHPEIIARFQKEMDTLKSLDSPNVIRIIGTGMENGIPYFIMEYIEGNTLSHYIGWRGLGDDVDRTLPIFEQISKGVEAVHAKDLIHRDIKPDNIMMANDGRIVLLDLGIIK